jgi:putative endonuclease
VTARIAAHQAGAAGDDAARRLPVTLVRSRDFSCPIYAREADRRIKGPSRAKKLALIRGGWALISNLARSRKAE